MVSTIEILKRTRDYVIADTELSEYITQRYSKPLNHLIGYEKGNASAGKCPQLCYVLGKKTYTKMAVQAVTEACLVLQIIEPNAEDGIKNGSKIIDELSNKLVLLLNQQPTNAAFLQDFVVDTDYGTQHPFYESKISFTFHTRTH